MSWMRPSACSRRSYGGSSANPRSYRLRKEEAYTSRSGSATSISSRNTSVSSCNRFLIAVTSVCPRQRLGADHVQQRVPQADEVISAAVVLALRHPHAVVHGGPAALAALHFLLEHFLVTRLGPLEVLPGHAEVDDVEVPRAAVPLHEVVGLHVSMHPAPAVHVAQAQQHVANHLGGHPRWQHGAPEELEPPRPQLGNVEAGQQIQHQHMLLTGQAEEVLHARQRRLLTVERS
eukprot:scaffold331_cov243-Pinguiococcus_pyrenoidosus.AAC.6